MAGSAKKSTKKFEKKHLKDTLERRKVAAKGKQRHQQNEKRKAQSASRREAENEATESSPDESKKQMASRR